MREARAMLSALPTGLPFFEVAGDCCLTQPLPGRELFEWKFEEVRFLFRTSSAGQCSSAPSLVGGPSLCAVGGVSLPVCSQ